MKGSGDRQQRQRAQHRHDVVDRRERYETARIAAAEAKPTREFDFAEWEHQHVQAEIQTLRYGPNMRDRLQRLNAIHFDAT